MARSLENPNDLPEPARNRVEVWDDKETNAKPDTVRKGDIRTFDEGVGSPRPALAPGAEMFIEVPIDPPMPDANYVVGVAVNHIPPAAPTVPGSTEKGDIITQVVRREPARVLVRIANQHATRPSWRWKLAVSVQYQGDPVRELLDQLRGTPSE